MRAVVLAAGRGTRLGALTANLPKPLVRVAGRPIIEHILRGLARAGVSAATIVTGHLGERIEERLGDGRQVGLALTYRRQENPDGTAPALLAAAPDLRDGGPFLLTWGDIVVEPRAYRDLIAAWPERPRKALLLVNEVDDPCRGAAVELDPDRRVRRIVEKPPRGTSPTRWNNAGVMILEPLVLDYAERVEPSPRGERELPDALAALIADGHPVHALPLPGLWRDVGTPGDLAELEALLSESRGSG